MLKLEKYVMIMLCKVGGSMSHFDKKDFGENIRKFRKAKGLSQENLAMAIGKAPATIARYEKGEIIPNAEQIHLICDELGIYEYELFNCTRKLSNTENSINPFHTDTLYLYYITYFPKSKKYDKGKFRLKLIEKPDFRKVDFMDYKKDYIYLSGYLQADHHIAVFVFENYKENNLRFELSHMIVNIARGTHHLMLGSLHCTNGEYVPSIRKCLVSKEYIEFTDELLEKLKITDSEKEELNKDNILYLDITDTYAFENE